MKQMSTATLLVFLVGCGKPADTGPSAPAAATTPHAKARAVVTQWLEDEKRGDGHLTSWCSYPGTEVFGGKMTLHAVRSYDIKSVTAEPNVGEAGKWYRNGVYIVRVRVESSDRDGRHITKDYGVAVGDTGSTMCLIGGR
ncbi:MAG: hypothetical protein U0804_12735 [Gemmataceae bacterium]